MTMQSYLDSGTDGSLVDELFFQPAAQLVRDGPRFAGAVVVADEHAVAVRDQAIVGVDAHLELEPDARAAQLAWPDEGPHLLAVVRGRAVADVALGEDEPELAAARLVLGRDCRQVVDPRGLEEAQELDVVHVLHRVEVAEADALHHREGGLGRAPVPLGVRHSGSGICIRAMAFTSFQNSRQAGPRMATTITMSIAVDARRASTATTTISSARITCISRTAQ